MTETSVAESRRWILSKELKIIVIHLPQKRNAWNFTSTPPFCCSVEMLAPCRRVWRLWSVLLSVSAISVVLLWRSHDEASTPDETERDDWVAVR
jgi:hypothetical protein